MFAEEKVRRLRRQLAEWLWPDVTRTAVTPGESCDHSHNPELMMRRLQKAADRDPVLLAETLAEFAGCGGCLSSVLVHALYTVNGIALDCKPKDVATLPPGCACETSPEMLATAVTLALDAGDDEQLRAALRPIWGCSACAVSTIVAIGDQKVNILDGLETTLRPALDKELHVIFGQAGS